MLLRYGSVEIHAASGANTIRVKNINRPDKFIDILEETVSRRANQIHKNE